MTKMTPDTSIHAAHKPEIHLNQCCQRRDSDSTRYTRNAGAILIPGEIKVE